MSEIASTPLSSSARSAAWQRMDPRNRWLICSALLLAAVLLLRWLLWRGALFPGDHWAADLGSSHKAWLIYRLTRAYQQVGRPLPAIGEVLIMVIWLWRTAGRRAAQGLGIALLASASCGLIKTVCGPTPLWSALHHVGSNFPSGVVTFMTAAVGYVAAVAWRRQRKVIAVVLLVAIAGAGPARVLGGQHLLSDVLGGYLLGTAWLILALRYLSASERRSSPRGRLRPRLPRRPPSQPTTLTNEP